jgi:hypothetical protein
MIWSLKRIEEIILISLTIIRLNYNLSVYIIKTILNITYLFEIHRKDSYMPCEALAHIHKYHEALHSRCISGFSAYTPKGKSHLIWPKSEEKQDTDDFTYQDPCDGLLGGGHMTCCLKR